MNILVKYSFAGILLLCTFSAHAERTNYSDFSIQQLQDQAATIHPAGLYILAKKLFISEKKDDAVFWLTVGHLRFRFYLATKPSSTSLDGPTLFSTLQNFIGVPINDYAGINPDNWVVSAKKAKHWDLNNDNDYTSKEKYKKEYVAIHVEMDDMIDYIDNNKDKIRDDRKQTAFNIYK